MLEKLKKEVCQANKDLQKFGLVILTWGNVSGISDDRKYIVIKPSGVEYDTLLPNDMVVVDLSNSKKIEGKLNPSSDTQTHIELYRNFKNIKGIVHTHSNWATSFAQAELPIKCYGTTHADYFYGDIPCTRKLINREIENNYEQNTGKVIVETFVKNNYDYNNIPAVLVSNHGPFVWGSSPQNAVHNAYVLENIAELAYKTKTLNLKILTIDKNLLDKHYLRKHGKNAYYGQSAKRK